ncbi:hypothetical protein CROQUDRAFT_101241 [Cronartium quercuum f. sp. fusiforme G11]|uniref:Uncharacterized protein n=1 Tax=Cronartium quercuum f. sp. fusiforme G11 TaxID=708437 RepID=A0A9P6N9E7_9BASI|nr:hypothetical protein CROQUDRAFT_101241 [Cronartium quercuum f. sp. fusiforme G11]
MDSPTNSVHYPTSDLKFPIPSINQSTPSNSLTEINRNIPSSSTLKKEDFNEIGSQISSTIPSSMLSSAAGRSPLISPIKKFSQPLPNIKSTDQTSEEILTNHHHHHIETEQTIKESLVSSTSLNSNQNRLSSSIEWEHIQIPIQNSSNLLVINNDKEEENILNQLHNHDFKQEDSLSFNHDQPKTIDKRNSSDLINWIESISLQEKQQEEEKQEILNQTSLFNLNQSLSKSEIGKSSNSNHESSLNFSELRPEDSISQVETNKLLLRPISISSHNLSKVQNQETIQDPEILINEDDEKFIVNNKNKSNSLNHSYDNISNIDPSTDLSKSYLKSESGSICDPLINDQDDSLINLDQQSNSQLLPFQKVQDELLEVKQKELLTNLKSSNLDQLDEELSLKSDIKIEHLSKSKLDQIGSHSSPPNSPERVKKLVKIKTKTSFKKLTTNIIVIIIVGILINILTIYYIPRFKNNMKVVKKTDSVVNFENDRVLLEITHPSQSEDGSKPIEIGVKDDVKPLIGPLVEEEKIKDSVTSNDNQIKDESLTIKKEKEKEGTMKEIEKEPDDNHDDISNSNQLVTFSIFLVILFIGMIYMIYKIINESIKLVIKLIFNDDLSNKEQTKQTVFSNEKIKNQNEETETKSYDLLKSYVINWIQKKLYNDLMNFLFLKIKLSFIRIIIMIKGNKDEIDKLRKEEEVDQKPIIEIEVENEEKKRNQVKEKKKKQGVSIVKQEEVDKKIKMKRKKSLIKEDVLNPINIIKKEEELKGIENSDDEGTIIPKNKRKTNRRRSIRIEKTNLNSKNNKIEPKLDQSSSSSSKEVEIDHSDDEGTILLNNNEKMDRGRSIKLEKTDTKNNLIESKLDRSSSSIKKVEVAHSNDEGTILLNNNDKINRRRSIRNEKTTKNDNNEDTKPKLDKSALSSNDENLKHKSSIISRRRSVGVNKKSLVNDVILPIRSSPRNKSSSSNNKNQNSS